MLETGGFSLLAQRVGEPLRGVGGLGEEVRDLLRRGLLGHRRERPMGEARGDVGERVRTVRRVDEIAVEHDVVAHTGERDALRRE